MAPHLSAISEKCEFRSQGGGCRCGDDPKAVSSRMSDPCEEMSEPMRKEAQNWAHTNSMPNILHPFPSRPEGSMASLKLRRNLPSSIIPTLQSYSDLITLVSCVNNSTALYSLLNTTKKFTFFALINDTVAQWILQTQANHTPSADVSEAILTYHILNGSWLTVEFKNEPQFVSTSLTNASYSNVTIFPSGQRVELVDGSGGEPEIVTSNKTVTTISSKVCTSKTRQI